MGSTAMPQAAGTLANATKGLWQKSLRDLITGIRSNKERQKDFMNKCLQDIRAEVRPPARPPTRAQRRTDGVSRDRVSRSRSHPNARAPTRARPRAHARDVPRPSRAFARVSNRPTRRANSDARSTIPASPPLFSLFFPRS